MTDYRYKTPSAKRIIHDLFPIESSPVTHQSRFSSFLGNISNAVDYWWSSLHQFMIGMIDCDLHSILYDIKLFKEKQLYFNTLIFLEQDIAAIEQVFKDLLTIHQNISSRHDKRRHFRYFTKAKFYYHRELEAISNYAHNW